MKLLQVFRGWHPEVNRFVIINGGNVGVVD